MNTILVTGGMGFIGSNLINKILLQTDSKVINLDALTYAANPNNLGWINANVSAQSRYTFIHGRIEDYNVVNKIVSEFKPSVIINVAAETHVDNSIVNSTPFIHTNIVGTHTLLEAARTHNEIVYKFIQISTDEVYGSLGRSGKFNELSPIDPSSPYSASKASADHLALSYYNTYNLPVCVTRCSNNYGWNQHSEKLIPKMTTNALHNKSIPIYGNGENVRDWIWVEDHVDAIMKVMHKGRNGEAYNIGANEERTNLQLAKMILDILNKPESLIQFVEDRLGHDYRYAIDSSKITRELGWAPTLSLESRLPSVIQEIISLGGHE